jgi:hypothetical protein
VIHKERMFGASTMGKQNFCPASRCLVINKGINSFSRSIFSPPSQMLMTTDSSNSWLAKYGADFLMNSDRLV